MSSIVVARGVSHVLPNGRELFTDLNFSLERGLTALVGPNGVGKTCLASILAGVLEPTAGSGGERLRAAPAQGFLSARQPDLLMLDEPTNNLDSVNVEFLESIVREFRGALVVVAHDERFVANCGVGEELVLP